MRKGKPILDAKGRPRFVRGEDKSRHWSRTAFEAMVKLWREAWLTSGEKWDPSKPMGLYITAHFDGREGGHLDAEITGFDFDGIDDHHTSAPDLDNIGKLVAEAAQKAGIVTNDAQICVLVAMKKKKEAT
jgi:Holliday junction resolvase RusA-like endonuclease